MFFISLFWGGQGDLGEVYHEEKKESDKQNEHKTVVQCYQAQLHGFLASTTKLTKALTHNL